MPEKAGRSPTQAAACDINVPSSGPTTEQWPGQEPETDSKAIAILEAADQQAVEAKLRELVGPFPKIVALDEISER